MKKTVLILFAILCATMTFGQGKYKTGILIKLYNGPSFNGPQIIVNTGRIIEIKALTGNFLPVTYNEKELFMPYGNLKDCIKVDENGNAIYQKPITDTVLKSINALVYEQQKVAEPIKVAEPPKAPDYGADIRAIKAKLYRISDGGTELHSAGNLMLTGTFIGLGGGVATYLLTRNGNTTFGAAVGIGSGVTCLIITIVGYTKLKEAGKLISFGTTSSGIGLSFNLNK